MMLSEDFDSGGELDIEDNPNFPWPQEIDDEDPQLPDEVAPLQSQHEEETSHLESTPSPSCQPISGHRSRLHSPVESREGTHGRACKTQHGGNRRGRKQCGGTQGGRAQCGGTRGGRAQCGGTRGGRGTTWRDQRTEGTRLGPRTQGTAKVECSQRERGRPPAQVDPHTDEESDEQGKTFTYKKLQKMCIQRNIIHLVTSQVCKLAMLAIAVDGRKWKAVDPTSDTSPGDFAFTGQPGPQTSLTPVAEPYEFFQLSFGSDTICMLIRPAPNILE